MSHLGIVNDIDVGVNGINDIDGIGGGIVVGKFKVQFQIGLFGDARSIVQGGNETLAIRTRDQGQIHMGKGCIFASLCHCSCLLYTSDAADE